MPKKTVAAKIEAKIVQCENNLNFVMLGSLSPHEFLSDYWQKKPLLIRGAFPEFADPGFAPPLTIKEILTLAKREEAESRLIVRRTHGKNGVKKPEWQLQQGPFTAKDFRDLATLADSIWTVLIQDTQHFSHEAHQLLQKFNFIPNARIDDLMVSYAVKGGGVGPHVDSYDVFLLQGHGQRRWQISAQDDLRLQPNMPLKILSHFKAEQDWVLNPGDMLYLPPDIAHHGVAETDECVTWSVGFRAPSQQELTTAFIDYLYDELRVDGQYLDPDLRPTVAPGEIDANMLQRVATMLNPLQQATSNKSMMARFLGCYLTEPKSHVYFDAPEDCISSGAFTKAVKPKAARGVSLDPKTRLLYDDDHIYLNGEIWLDRSSVNDVENTTRNTTRNLATVNDEYAAWQSLSDARTLASARLSSLSPAALEKFYKAYCDGYLHLN